MNRIKDADGQHGTDSKCREQGKKQKPGNICRKTDDGITKKLFRPLQ